MPSVLSEISQTLGSELERLNQRIMLALSSHNEMMNTIVSEYLRRKGKQIRPITVILASRLFQPNTTERIIATAAAIEMLHNASLIHDDVVDLSTMRRNEPTINGIWDNHIAVLTGDYFTSTSLQLASATEDLRIVNSLATLGRKLSTGELNQVYNARYHRLSEANYMDTIERKTASLFQHCAEMGAFAAEVDSADPRLQALSEFARLLGLCFQITDDIFDYFPSSADLGKPTGNDLREGKVTLPLLHVLLNEDAPQHQEMLALICRESLTTEEIDLLTTYAHENGGIDYARSVLNQLADQARNILCQAFEPSPAREDLLRLLAQVIDRKK